MSNIRLDEWAATSLHLYRQLDQAARFVQVEHEIDKGGEIRKIRIEAEGCSGSIELRMGHDKRGMCLRPEVRFQSSAGLPTSLTQARSRHIIFGNVLDLLTIAKGQVDHLTVWPNGECPCDFCNGSGEQRPGSSCPRCEGKGVR